MADTSYAGPAPARPRLASPLAIGAGAIALFFGGFGVWAAQAPLAAAVLAPGIVVPDSARKTVQHLEGGIVAELLVAEGQTVAAGDPLIVLDRVQSQAAQDVLRIRHSTALAEKARLLAERDGLPAIAFPDDLLHGDEGLEALRESQETAFAARRRSLDSQTAIVQQRIAQLQEEVAGLREAVAAQERQLALLDEEAAAASRLVEKGLGTKPRLLALQREQAKVEGALAENRARIARAGQQIGEAQLEIEDLQARWRGEIAGRLREVEQTILDAQERLKASEDRLVRTVIRAPVSGSVMDLKVFTVGGVIRPGEPLLDIVPEEAPMIVEARVRPTDVDSLHPGQPARVRLSAFSVRNTPLIEGRVDTVTADALLDERTGSHYFQARVKLTPEALDALGPGRPVTAGMPAEVMIETGTRTMLDFFLSPLALLLERGMREE